jgi:hypothetical protein
MNLAAVVLISLAAGSGTGADPAACASIPDDPARLACYDRIFRPAPPATDTGSVASAAGAATPAAVATAAVAGPSAEEQFGLTAGQLRGRSGEEPIEALRSVVAGVEITDSRAVIRLENGQRWRQLEATDRPLFTVGAPVEIRSAALGSFLASVPGSKQPAVRVRRLD